MWAVPLTYGQNGIAEFQREVSTQQKHNFN